MSQPAEASKSSHHRKPGDGASSGRSSHHRKPEDGPSSGRSSHHHKTSSKPSEPSSDTSAPPELATAQDSVPEPEVQPPPPVVVPPPIIVPSSPEEPAPILQDRFVSMSVLPHLGMNISMSTFPTLSKHYTPFEGTVRENTPEEYKLADLINQYRQKNGRGPLRLDNLASSIGDSHTQKQFEKNSLSHDGARERLYHIPGLKRGGENTGRCRKKEDPYAYIFNHWTKEPTENKNLLGDYNVLGLSLLISKKIYYVTALFANVPDNK